MSTTKRAEAWFQALREFRTEFESIPSPPRPDTGRTAVIRRPFCAACSFEPQAWLHNELLRADTREKVEGVAYKIKDLNWRKYRDELKMPDLEARVLSVETLIGHQRECMHVEFAGNFPSGIEYVFVPGGRVQVAKLRKLIDTAPRGEVKTEVVTRKHRVTVMTKIHGHHEFLMALLHNKESRTTLVDAHEAILGDKVTQGIRDAMVWLSDQISRLDMIEKPRVKFVPDSVFENDVTVSV